MSQPASHPRAPAWALILLGAAAFTAAYGQAPLYYSNQNQYFLHGLADGGHGLLADDWLANTLDPTPVFSGLVALTTRFLHPWAFYLYHALLLTTYAAALIGLFRVVAGEGAARRWPVFLTLLVAVHSAPARWLSFRLLGLDYPWYFQSGVAGQYVLGAMLQPSTFGVLLVAAVCLFAQGRSFWAGACVALAATIHATYLLPGALLTLGFLAELVRAGQPRRAAALGAFTLVLVLPVVGYALRTFAPTSAETFARAQEILVNFRIPHHTRLDLWLDPIAALQIAWVGLALVLMRGTRLFLVLAVPFVGSVLLSALQVAIESNTLALLFPWRLSAVLVPVATTVILTRLVALPPLSPGHSWAGVGAAGVVAVLAVGGLWISFGRLAFRMDDAEEPLLAFVRRTRAPGDVYFLPIEVPRLAKTVRGSASSDFKPLVVKRRDGQTIPVGLQGFRLAAGAPIYVDFKAIPYRDVEVIEWRERLRVVEMVRAWIEEGRWPEVVAELRSRGVTHLILPAGQEVPAVGLERVDAEPDSPYRVYRLTSRMALQASGATRTGRPREKTIVALDASVDLS